MKTITKLVSILFVAIFFNTNAQNKENLKIDSLQPINRWTLGVSFNTIENNGNKNNNTFNKSLGLSKQSANNGNPIRLNFGYRVSPLLGIDLSGSLNRWNANEGFLDNRTITEDLNYSSIDLDFKFYLDELFLDEPIDWGLALDWLDVYMIGGLGYFNINKGSASANLGFGTNIWITKHLGASINAISKWSLNSEPVVYDSNHTMYSLGLAYRFKSQDKDNDGVYDYNDHCPNTPGSKHFNGCPEEEEEEKEKEKEEEVEEEVETIDKPLVICDTDNDGIVDASDICPEVFGEISNYGCPKVDSDGDGVIDSLDNCPDTTGPANNNGCPILNTLNKILLAQSENLNSNDEVYTNSSEILIELAKQIKFDAGNYNFTQKTYPILLAIVKLMKQNPNSTYKLMGHSDSVGSFRKNRILSKARANAVRNYLIDGGIPQENLKASGLGESKPVDSNINMKGRANNRRIEILELE